VDPSQLKSALKAIETPITHPDFYRRVFNVMSRNRLVSLREQDPQLAEVLGQEYINLTKRLKATGIQEAASVRNVLRTRALSQYLINDQGELVDERLAQVEEYLKKGLYSLGPERQHDARRQEHMLSVIRLLRQRRDLRQLLMKMSKPTNHRMAEQIIRDTLQLPHSAQVTDVHARQAALAAWLCFLRQNVGSCFATAPAIIVHDEQPQQFLHDLDELLSTGRLKRTFGGGEYNVPISSTWGAGDLRRPFGIWRDINHVGNNMWESPGILAGLKAVELIDAETPREAEIQAVKKLVDKALDNWEGDKPYVFTNSEELFKRILLAVLELTPQDIVDYENRPKPMLQSNLMMFTSPTRKTGGSKSERCAHCITDLEIACNAFKALTDNALLRVWEFTVASFAETKSNFSTWNLYSSLGFGANESGGIGNCLHQIIQQKLEQANRLVQKHQDEYEEMYIQLKYMEGRIKRASTEQEAKWLNIEYQTRRNEFYTIETLRNRAQRKAQVYANLFAFLINKFIELFPNYFQEVYDADLHDVDVGPYDDSPAGFRLLFKHGRPNTAVWTRIYNPTQYVEALSSFFTMTEPLLQGSPEMEGFEEDLTQIVTAVISHVKTIPFIESALYRMAAKQGGRMIKDPLQHLDKLEKKPWAYTSGGNMETLISCYFRSDQHTTSERWVENEMELAVFFLDLVKKMPANVSENYLQDSHKSLLIHSPTHAFLFKAGFDLFRRGVADKTFTYTWVRDQVFLPAKRFTVEQYLDREFILHLVGVLEQEMIPPEYREVYRDVFYTVPGKLTGMEVREHLFKEISRSPKLQRYGSPLVTYSDIDSFLYKHLPITRGYDVERRVKEVIERLTSLTEQERQQAIAIYIQLAQEAPAHPPATSQELQNIVKGILCLLKGPLTTVNFHKEVATAVQTLGYAMPPPLIFADTNWVTDFFAFAVNPGTAEFELWRVDETGTIGAPMNYWKHWLDGSRRDRTWGVFTNPTEYRS
jgi:hypothetical protein